jgi:hypothetical protein
MISDASQHVRDRCDHLREHRRGAHHGGERASGDFPIQTREISFSQLKTTPGKSVKESNGAKLPQGNFLEIRFFFFFFG